MFRRKSAHLTPKKHSVTHKNVWDDIRNDVRRHIPDSTVEMMLAMTQGNIHETILMVLGYVIQRLDLLAKSEPDKRAEYTKEMEHYRAVLQECLKTPPDSLQ